MGTSFADRGRQLPADLLVTFDLASRLVCLLVHKPDKTGAGTLHTPLLNQIRSQYKKPRPDP